VRHEIITPGVEIYQGDCAGLELESESIDLTVTSPPYDNLRDYEGFVFDFEAIADQLYRITKLGGVVVWVVGDATIDGSESGTSFRQALYFMDIGFRLHDTMIYRKINYIPLTHNRYEQAFEYMFVFSKGSPKTFNPIMVPTKTAGDVYNLSRKGYCATIKKGAQRRRDETVVVNDEKIKSNIFSYTCGGSRLGHPAPFPENLARDQILSWSNPGGIVYDPMMGSGTTGKMAVKYDRRFIGCDISDNYYEIAKRRIYEATLQMRLPLDISQNQEAAL
jgi:site-specific DNA-methyltransferase (adenine-specific)